MLQLIDGGTLDSFTHRSRPGLEPPAALSSAMALELITSVLLTVEDVHGLGYSINDLKYDNLMLSRRGQLKVVDLDGFSPASTPGDRAMDFMLFAACIASFAAELVVAGVALAVTAGRGGAQVRIIEPD